MNPDTDTLWGNLLPGDHLLYWTRCLADYAICLKTWSDVAHIEIYDGDGMSLAARAEGVNKYYFRSEGLKVIRRPLNWYHSTAREYFKTVRGQRYDWPGLLCFSLAVKQGAPDKKFCSELARDIGRAAGSKAFDANWPGDKVAPGNFEMVGDFTTFYRAEK